MENIHHKYWAGWDKFLTENVIRRVFTQGQISEFNYTFNPQSLSVFTREQNALDHLSYRHSNGSILACVYANKHHEG